MSRRDASSAKALAGQRKYRRKWLTFLRMLRYGVNNFSRNAWLTVAATAVMTITLLIIFMTFVAQNVLSDTATEIGKRIDRSIYLKPETTEAQAKQIMDKIAKLDNVEQVTFKSSAQARADYAKENKQNSGTLEAINEATNRIPATISVGLKNVNDTNSLIKFVQSDETVKKYIDPVRQPTFVGQRKDATGTIASWTQFAQRVGIVASIIFVSISSLIIFNTIRMAIFNRKEEIQMMKLIGADKSFIRGPFVVEAVVYGFIAAIIATVLGLLLLTSISVKLKAYGVTIDPTVTLMTAYIPVVLVAMIVLGGLIGIISSLFATRRYLKI
jgi:cell division transport system permease protein